MKKYLLFLLPIFLTMFLSCNKASEPVFENKGIIGTWVYESDSLKNTVMQKSDSLSSDKYGFIFFADGNFIERKEAGWCGTPPVSYSNFKGKWSLIADNIISINVAYWGGQESYKMQIITVSDKYLIYNRIN